MPVCRLRFFRAFATLHFSSTTVRLPVSARRAWFCRERQTRTRLAEWEKDPEDSLCFLCRTKPPTCSRNPPAFSSLPSNGFGSKRRSQQRRKEAFRKKDPASHSNKNRRIAFSDVFFSVFYVINFVLFLCFEGGCICFSKDGNEHKEGRG